MTPDDIPTEITQLTYTAPGPKLSQNGAAELLAHYWPTIQAHIARQLADQLQRENPDRSADFSEGVDWATGMLRAAIEV